MPINDWCDTCYKLSHMGDEDKELNRSDQEAHIERKTLARTRKDAIKAETESGKKLLS